MTSTNALTDTAKIVKKAWCQSYLHNDDRHCLLGAMVVVMAEQLGMYLDRDFVLLDRKGETQDQYAVLRDTTEARVLAETIVESYPDLIGKYAFDKSLKRGMYDDVIFEFNDDEKTQREDVVAVLEKAAAKMDEQA